MTDVDKALETLVRLLPEVTAGLKRASRATLPGPLAPRHIPALSQLLDNGPMSVSDLATHLGLALTTTSLLTTQLADHGLVVRREDPTDRRRTLLDLAPDQREAITDWLGARSRPMRRALTKMTPTERTALCHALELLAAEI